MLLKLRCCGLLNVVDTRRACNNPARRAMLPGVSARLLAAVDACLVTCNDFWTCLEGFYKCLTQWVNVHARPSVLPPSYQARIELASGIGKEQPDVSSPVHGRCLQDEAVLKYWHDTALQ